MLNRNITLGLIAGFAAINTAFATMPGQLTVRSDAPAAACPETAYVVYPEASHVVYAEGICRFGTAADTTPQRAEQPVLPGTTASEPANASQAYRPRTTK